MLHSTDMEGRIKRHNSGNSKPTKYGIPWKIVYTKDFTTKFDAYQFEMLKK